MAHQTMTIIDKIQERLREKSSIGEALELTAAETGKSIAAVSSVWYRHRPPSEDFNHSKSMTPDEEKLALACLQAFAISSLPLDLKTARDMIKDVVGVYLPGSTFYDWVKRHKSSVNLRKPKDISKKRIGMDKMDEINEWITRLETHFGPNSTRKWDGWVKANYDETTIDFNSELSYVINKTGIPQTNILTTKNNQRCSLLPFVLSTGHTFLSIVIVQGRPGESEGFFVPEAGDTRYPTLPKGRTRLRLYRTENGRLRQEDFMVIMDEFATQWRAQYPWKPILVFGDQSSVHTNDQIIHKMFLKDIWLCYFPSDTSHFLQPLDNVPFANFKRAFANFYRKVRHSPHHNKDERYYLMIQAAIDAEHKSFSQKTILEGFKSTGLVPFDPAKIIQNAQNTGPEDLTIGPHAVPIRENFVVFLQKWAEGDKKTTKRRQAKIGKRRLWFAKDFIGEVLLKNAGAPPKKKPKLKALPETLDQMLQAGQRVCPVADCGRKRYRGGGWSACELCGQCFCPRHGKEKQVHEENCIAEG